MRPLNSSIHCPKMLKRKFLFASFRCNWEQSWVELNRVESSRVELNQVEFWHDGNMAKWENEFHWRKVSKWQTFPFFSNFSFTAAQNLLLLFLFYITVVVVVVRILFPVTLLFGTLQVTVKIDFAQLSEATV